MKVNKKWTACANPCILLPCCVAEEMLTCGRKINSCLDWYLLCKSPPMLVYLCTMGDHWSLLTGWENTQLTTVTVCLTFRPCVRATYTGGKKILTGHQHRYCDFSPLKQNFTLFRACELKTLTMQNIRFKSEMRPVGTSRKLYKPDKFPHLEIKPTVNSNWNYDTVMWKRMTDYILVNKV